MIIKMVENAGLDQHRVVEGVAAVNRLAVEPFRRLHEGSLSRSGSGARRRGGRGRDDSLLHLRGRELQTGGVLGVVVFARGSIGDALQLRALLVGDVKADNVYLEMDSGVVQRLRCGAGIAVAVFLAVGEQYDDVVLA